MHKVLIGHNRWATTGAINAKNAHPFNFKGLVGCHNGTLVDQTLLDNHKNFEVDSENLFDSINNEGVRETIRKTHGAYALTWYDKKEDSINFLRNSQRPLCYVFSLDQKTIFWASEEWMLKVINMKHNLKLGEIHKLGVETWTSIKLPEKGHQQLEDIRASKVEVYVPPVKKTHGYHPNYYNDMVRDTRRVTTTTSGVNNFAKKSFPQSSNLTNLFEVSVQDRSLMRSLVNKEIPLRMTGYSGVRSSFVACRSLSNPQIVTRLYIEHGSAKWDELKLSKNSLMGTRCTVRIKTIGPNFEYLVGDLRTVKIVDSMAVVVRGTTNTNHSAGNPHKTRAVVNKYGIPPVKGGLKVVQKEETFIDKEDRQLYEIYNGVLVPRKEFDKLTEDGCTWCSGPLFPMDHKDIKWGDSKDPFCSDCIALPDVIPFLR